MSCAGHRARSYRRKFAVTIRVPLPPTQTEGLLPFLLPKKQAKPLVTPVGIRLRCIFGLRQVDLVYNSSLLFQLPAWKKGKGGAVLLPREVGIDLTTSTVTRLLLQCALHASMRPALPRTTQRSRSPRAAHHLTPA